MGRVQGHPREGSAPSRAGCKGAEETNPRGTRAWMRREARTTSGKICTLHLPQLLEIPLLSRCLCRLLRPSWCFRTGRAWEGHGESWDAHTHQTRQHLCKNLLLMLNMCCAHSARAPATNPLQDLQGSARVTGLTREMQTRHPHPT